jgi:hypothetical protein
MSESQNLLRKITTRTLGYGKRELQAAVKAVEESSEESAHLYNLAGRAKRTERGESNFGPWCAFKGEFLAVLPDQTEYRSPKCFIPEPFGDMMESHVEQVDENGELRYVQTDFAIEVHVVPAENAVGYEYKVIPIMKAQEGDELLHLRSEMDKHKPKALPAPKKEDAKPKK